MQKIAQRRGILNKLREFSNVSGRAAESFFNPQFKAIMEELRKKDDQIRSIVAGAKIGEGEMPQSKAMKDLLKQAKSNLNRREFMSAVADLGRFHDQMQRVVGEIEGINDKVNEVHNEFLFKDLKDEHKEQLGSLREKFEKKLQSKKASINKEAGIMDFLHNIGTTRGRALAAWEKRYPQETNKFKNGITTLLQKSQGLLETTLSSLKEMASARASRNIDDYVKAAARITKSFNVYDDGKGGFTEFYSSVLKPYMAKMDAFTGKPAAETASPTVPAPGAQQMSQQEVTVEAPAPAQPPAGAAPSPGVGTMLPPPMPTNVGPAVPAPQESAQALNTLDQMEKDRAAQEHAQLIDPNGPPTIRAPQFPPAQVKVQHQKFYSTLESLSGESPILLASFIRKYAASIQEVDPETSVNLFKIAKSIRG
jgi:ElaB/YqjD/DUF883 family membrane-anchored ribosome-binding protein